MLILASVSISMIVNDEIFNYAGQAVEETEKAKNDEQELVNSAINNYIKPNLKVTGHDGETFSKIYTKTKEYTDTEGNTAVIPKGFAVGTSPEINKISTGLVISDANGNEFVWIPVTVTSSDTETDIAAFYRSNWTNNARSTSLKDSTTYIEPYTNGYTNETAEYNEMVKSVYKNKGFYIGRYEAGSTTPRTGNADGTTKMVVQRDAYPYNYVGWGTSVTNYTEEIGKQGLGALALSKAMYANENVGVTSTLCYGVMWDAMLDYIKDDSHSVTYSKTWGNYNDNTGNTWKIARKSAKWTIDTSSADNWTTVGEETKEKTNSESILLTTGANDNFKAKNIYDVAGNLGEWTNEGHTGYERILRDGGFMASATVMFPSSRYGYDSASDCRVAYGFRPALYIK